MALPPNGELTEIVPELLIPPVKSWTVSDAAALLAADTWPPISMPLPPAEMVPELLMPPA